MDLFTLKATPLTSKQQNLPQKRHYAVSSVVSSIASYQLSTQIGRYNGVVLITADGWLAMIIPVAIVAITATWALSIRGLEALVHSQNARGNTNQNIVLCALTRRTECAMTHLWLLQALLRVSTQRSNKSIARL